ncbi:MAG: phosphotransferase [Litoreibacter sp.]|nr:phosphotransferase [Litoreibacter sp.]MCY4333532.1 phosphotransferase [Litoreibacter sp.]
MTNRAAQLKTFLTLAGWGQASRHALAGDASNRRYLRLANIDGARAVLMDAPPDTGEDIAPFIAIAEHLTRRGFSAPALLARDVREGFLLLEDLGDDLFARVLEADPSQEGALYTAATDVLIHLHAQKPREGLKTYGPFEMAEAACLSLDWYARFAGQPAAQTDRSSFRDLIQTMLDKAQPSRPVMALRDYHAENLIWLPGRHGYRRVGLLDFQDAMLSHPAYDLVSLLYDARRDVSEETRTICLERYISATGANRDQFLSASSLCSAQRNLRIMGVFARLSIRDGKPSYPDLMPRVWGNLMRDLEHPDLAPLQALIAKHLPAPDAKIIKKIKTTHV